ncbi:MAG: hypothetical protein NT002_08490 [candidate division Zixibacteria bacterium]|nr:hypothetical protein [candidate division Zixibacteria bacterium]
MGYHRHNCLQLRGLPSRIMLITAMIFLGLMPIPMTAAIAADSAQVNHNEPLDLMTAPTAPGLVLLGTAPSSIEHPGNPTDLALTILNRIDNLNVLPEDMAVEFAPYWLFFGRKITYSEFESNNLGANFLQTLSFSIATSSRAETSPDTNSTSLGFGLRFSILRGEIDKGFEGYADRLDTLYKYLDTLAKDFDSVLRERSDGDPVLLALKGLMMTAGAEQQTWVEKSIGLRREAIKNELEREFRANKESDIERVRETISGMKLRRIGWKLDCAAGLVVDFPQRQFDKGDLSRYGAWLTGGYELGNLSAIWLVRLLGNQNKPDESSFDLGGRFNLSGWRQFSIAAESVYRKYHKHPVDKEQWRLAFLFDYAIARNKTLSFTFGRDFEGNKSGNLLSMVNLILGFGSDRPVTNR